MPKTSTKWVCQECGHTSLSYLGKCPECNSWGSLLEEVVSKNLRTETNGKAKNDFTLASDLSLHTIQRISSFDKELDNVLGGGFVPGSLILLSGEPGIGKSTILLQAACDLSKKLKAAYITAEESTYQVKLRAKRLNLHENNLLLLAENNLEIILSLIQKEKPNVVIIDSIQAIYDPVLESGCGNVSQVRECANKLLRLSKDNNITVILVGHVNKEGLIAGPKVLEHIVDTVLYFEGEKFHNFRILRATKNRYGCTDELAIFEMKETGLKTIPNPSYLFMSQDKEIVPGSTYTAISEGTKIIIAEVQALVGGISYSVSRRVANGLDYNRVLQIIAILERRVGFNFSKNDLFVNLVGGLTSDEPALDLGIAMSIVSCKQDVIPKKRTVFIGEIGLSGEIRQVNQIENRIKESIKLGFEQVVIPYTPDLSPEVKGKIEIIQVKKVLDAIRNTFTSQYQSS